MATCAATLSELVISIVVGRDHLASDQPNNLAEGHSPCNVTIEQTTEQPLCQQLPFLCILPLQELLYPFPTNKNIA